MKNSWKYWPLLALFLGACDSKKVSIPGKRIPVDSFESSVKVDEETSNLDIILPLPERGGDWSQVGSRATHKIPNFFLGNDLKPQWTVSVGSGNGEGRLLSSPIVSEGKVYTLDTYGYVSAFQALTGERLWQTNISPGNQRESIIGGGLAYGDGKIFVTSPHAEVLSLDPENGYILWRVPTGSPVRAAPTFSDGRLYALTISNHLEVLEAATGKCLWNHAGIMEYAGLLGTTSPAVAHGVVIVPYSSGEIYALKAENGHQLWLETLTSNHRPDALSALSHIKALPIIDKNNVIVLGYNQRMATYDLPRGEKIWERTIGGVSTPAVAGDYIFIINSESELLCLTRDYGQVVWVKKLEDCLEQKPSSKVLWHGPLLAGSQLYLVNSKGELITFNPKTGDLIIKRSLGASLSLPPVVAQESLYLLTDRGDLMMFK